MPTYAGFLNFFISLDILYDSDSVSGRSDTTSQIPVSARGQLVSSGYHCSPHLPVLLPSSQHSDEPQACRVQTAKNKPEANSTVRSATTKSLQKTGCRAGNRNVCKSRRAKLGVTDTSDTWKNYLPEEEGSASRLTKRGAQGGIWPSAPGTGLRRDSTKADPCVRQTRPHTCPGGQHHSHPYRDRTESVPGLRRLWLPLRAPRLAAGGLSPESAQLVQCPALRDPKGHPTAHGPQRLLRAVCPRPLPNPGGRERLAPRVVFLPPPLYFGRKGSPGSHRTPSLRAGRQVDGDAPLLIPEAQ